MHCIFVFPVIKQVEHSDRGYTDRQIRGKETANWFVMKDYNKASDILSASRICGQLQAHCSIQTTTEGPRRSDICVHSPATLKTGL